MPIYGWVCFLKGTPGVCEHTFSGPQIKDDKLMQDIPNFDFLISLSIINVATSNMTRDMKTHCLSSSGTNRQPQRFGASEYVPSGGSREGAKSALLCSLISLHAASGSMPPPTSKSQAGLLKPWIEEREIVLYVFNHDIALKQMADMTQNKMAENFYDQVNQII